MIKKSNKKIIKTIYVHEKLTHPTKKSLLQHTPKNIRFVFSDYSRQDISISSEKINESSLRSTVKKILKKILEILKLPRIKLFLPTKSKHYDYILSNYCLVLSIKKGVYGPLEHVGDILEYKYHKLKSRFCLSFLKLYILSNRCKYLFFMSESSKDCFQRFLNIPQKKSSKLQVIYPTLKPIKKKVKKESKEVYLLYIARLRKINPEYSFYVKGGHLVLKAYKELKEKYDNLKLIFVGHIPPEYQSMLASLRDVENYPQGFKGDIMELFQKADIFLFPSYIDGFGYTVIEAMANSLPVVCLNNHFAVRELVLNNKTGFILNTNLRYMRFPNTNFHPDWVQQLRFYNYIKKDNDDATLKEFISKIDLLIQNDNLRKEFGRNGRERLVNGDLSLSHRNEKLKRLFK